MFHDRGLANIVKTRLKYLFWTRIYDEPPVASTRRESKTCITIFLHRLSEGRAITWCLKKEKTGNYTECNIKAALYPVNCLLCWREHLLSHEPHWSNQSFKQSLSGIDLMVAMVKIYWPIHSDAFLQSYNGVDWEEWESRERISVVCIKFTWNFLFFSVLTFLASPVSKQLF